MELSSDLEIQQLIADNTTCLQRATFDNVRKHLCHVNGMTETNFNCVHQVHLNIVCRVEMSADFFTAYKCLSGWSKWLERWAAIAERHGSNITGDGGFCHRD